MPRKDGGFSPKLTKLKETENQLSFVTGLLLEALIIVESTGFKARLSRGAVQWREAFDEENAKREEAERLDIAAKKRENQRVCDLADKRANDAAKRAPLIKSALAKLSAADRAALGLEPD